jgi:hypothetical protein
MMAVPVLRGTVGAAERANADALPSRFEAEKNLIGGLV